MPDCLNHLADTETTLSKFDFDLFTIGGGSGGVRASRVAASYGARVGLAESGRLGGTCVNLGCIPKKLLSYAAHFRDEFETAGSYGWHLGEPVFDWRHLIENKDREIARLNAVYEKLLLAAGVTILRGRARIVDPHTVDVDGRSITAAHILVATGSHPVYPDIPGADLAIGSDAAFSLPALPASSLVVGGGYIAIEFASVFNGLGVTSALAHRHDTLLRGFDNETARHLAAELERKGVRLLAGSEPSSLSRNPDGSILTRFRDGSEISTGLVLLATGRQPHTAGLGLAAAGVELETDGSIRVDRYSRSSVASIHAIGDVTNRRNLTPVATAEGMALARTLFRGEPIAIDYECIPTAVFGNPNLATVGLSEENARASYPDVHIYRTAFRSLKHTLTSIQDRIFMKLVIDGATQRVLGAHMVGPEAGEIIQGIAIAVKLGATKAQFDATIGIHPTAAEEFVTLRERTA